ncbi:MAG TPA: hypothetical protein VJR47_10815 [Stellaceae bacterium]|nr:hypothetical protein [Stellaceae bacterium]
MDFEYCETKPIDLLNSDGHVHSIGRGAMSWDIWLQCFHEGEVAKFPSAIVHKAFQPFAVREDRGDEEGEGHWRLFGTGSHTTMSMDDGPMVEGLAINRPAGPPEFWEALLGVMRQTSTVFYWPGEGAAVADAAVIPHLPPELVKGVGGVTVVSTIEELFDLMKKA